MNQIPLLDTAQEIVWNEDEHDLKRLYEYCKQDVEATFALNEALDDLTDKENDLWQLDARMSFEGVKVDLHAAMVAAEGLKRSASKMHTTVSDLTSGVVSSVRQVAALRGFLKEQGVDLPDLSKATVESALAGDLPPVVRQLLELRQAGSKSSTAKLQRMIELADPDDHRIRQNLIYHGAATGRWTGSGVQLQNFPRGTLKPHEVEQALGMIDEPDAVEVCFGSYPETVSSCLRGFVIAEEGKTFVAADYSAIEARVLAWVAGQYDAVEMFARGEDPYVDMASEIFGVKPEAVTKDQRQLGKIAILGLGYGMGAAKFKATCESWGVTINDRLAKRAVDAYRSKYYRVVELWNEAEHCAKRSLTNHVGIGHENWSFYFGNSFLFLHLPSGRRLAYHNPRLEATSRDGWERDEIVFDGINSVTRKWSRQTTYGGKLVENCISEGTLVLTEYGWAPVELVVGGIKVHDGVDFVSHGGAVSKSVQACTQVDGVYMTPDHEVLTNEGWQTASSNPRPYRPNLRGVVDTTPRRVKRKKKKLGFPLPMWRGSDEGRDRRKERSQARGGAELWVLDQKFDRGQESQARHGQTPGILGLEVNAGPVSTPLPSSLPPVWGSWYRSLQALGGKLRIFLGGYERHIPKRSHTRPGRQQRGVYQGKLSLDRPRRAESEPARQFNRINPQGRHGCERSRRSVWDKALNVLQSDSAGLAKRKPIHQTQRPQPCKVFDIINCGPRQRFVVLGDSGPFIVHNCVQAIARDLLAEALVRVDRAGLNPVLTVHDEIVCEIDERKEYGRKETGGGVTFVDGLCNLMCELPDWAEGLPLAAEGWKGKRFRK